MKRILVLFLLAALLLAGCGREPVSPEIPASSETNTTAQTTEATNETTVPVDTPTERIPLYAVSVPAATEAFHHEDGTELFTYTAQHMQLIIPDEDVADKVVLDFLNRIDAAQTDAESVLSEAQNNYDPDSVWFPYFYRIIYSPMRVDRGVLSLFGTRGSYSGGMHSNVSCVSANYDLETGDPLTLGSIMHMDATKDDFVDLILAELGQIAEENYLYDDYKDCVHSHFSCDESVYEDFYFTDSGLCFFFSPYEIAPYASGIITVEIPYDKLLGLIYDGYFPDEYDTVTGTMHIKPFSEMDMEAIDNMAEVVLGTGETQVIYTDGNAAQISVNISDTPNTVPNYTAFRAYQMSKADAIVLHLPEEVGSTISVSYLSGGTISTVPLTE